MADTKISALTVATTPLAGTEVLPIVQSGVTKQVSVANLTSGRAVSVKNLLLEGGTLPAAGNPSIALRSSDNTIYLQSGSANTYVLLDKDQNTIAIIDKTNGVSVYGANFVQGTAAKGINFTANTGAAGMTSQLLNWYEEGTWTPNQGSGLTVVGAFSSAGVYTRVGRQVTVTGRVTGATSVNTSASGIVCTNLPFTVGTNSNSVGAMTNTATNNTNVYVNPSTTTMYSSIVAGASGSLYFTVTYSI